MIVLTDVEWVITIISCAVRDVEVLSTSTPAAARVTQAVVVTPYRAEVRIPQLALPGLGTLEIL